MDRPNDQSAKPPYNAKLSRVRIREDYLGLPTYIISALFEVDAYGKPGWNFWPAALILPISDSPRARSSFPPVQSLHMGWTGDPDLDIFLVDFKDMQNFTIAIREPDNENGPMWTMDLAGYFSKELIGSSARREKMFSTSGDLPLPPWNVVPAGTAVEPWYPSST